MSIDPIFITRIFIAFLLLKTLVQSYLDWRQVDTLTKNRNNVPEDFNDIIPLADHQKAIDYTLEKIKTGRFFRTFNTVILLFWTLGNGLEFIHRSVVPFGFGPIITGLFFFAILGIISGILGLPETLYSTFVLEEKYGFNKMDWKTFLSDSVKGLVLSLVIGFPLLALILFMMENLSHSWWFYAFIVIVLFQLLMIFIFPTYIAPLFNKFTPLEDETLKDRVVKLLERCDFKASGLFVMDASKRTGHGNAYFTGFGKNKRIVFFDTLLKNLDHEEVEAILAHELGHFKRFHIYKMVIVSWISLFVGLFVLNLLMKTPSFYTGHGVLSQTHYTTLALFSMVSGIYTFMSTPLSNYFSRKHEYEADHFASLTSKKEKLISSLLKLYKDNASSTVQDSLYSSFYHSHPNAKDRIFALKKL